MRGFKSLLWREWRDIRSVALGVAVVALVISVVVQHFVHKYAEPVWAAKTLCPMLTALFTWIVASDLVAGDVRTRRAATMAMLPVPLGRLWTAKVLFLAVVAVAFHVYALTVQAGIYVVAGRSGQVAEMVAHVGDAGQMLVFIVAATAAIVFCSTLGLRSIVAALIGVALTAAPLLALDALDWHRPLLQSWFGVALIPAGVLVLVVASRSAFVQGRAHTGRRLRPAVVGLAVLAAFALPAAGYAKVRATSYYHFEPRDPDVGVHDVKVSPDGAYLALDVNRIRGAQRTWVLRVEDGRLFDWALANESVAGWDAESRLVSWSHWTGQRLGFGRNFSGSSWLDPETGKAIDSTGSLAGRTGQVLRHWNNSVWWGKVASPTTLALTQHWVNVATRGEKYPVQSKGKPIPLADEGVVVLCDAKGRLMRVDTIAGTERVLAAEEYDRIVGLGAISPSRRYLVIRHKQRHRVIDVETGETVWRPATNKEFGLWAWAPTGVDRLQIRSGQPGRIRKLFDPVAGKEISLDHLLPQDDSSMKYLTNLQPLPDGRVVVVRRVGWEQDVLLLDEGGQIERTLYANDGEK